MSLLLQITGGMLVALAALHFIFPRYFDWKTELAPLSLINRQMMEVHTFFIALIVFLMGILCIIAAPLLVSEPLGKIVSGGIAIFWFARLLVQFFWYSSKLWKGKPFETFVHYAFTLLWTALTLLFTLVAVR